MNDNISLAGLIGHEGLALAVVIKAIKDLDDPSERADAAFFLRSTACERLIHDLADALGATDLHDAIDERLSELVPAGSSYQLEMEL